MVMIFIFGLTIFNKVESVLSHFEKHPSIFSESEFSEITFPLEFLMKSGIFLSPNVPGAT